MGRPPTAESTDRDGIAARLRASGSVFAEEEADVLLERTRGDDAVGAADLERMIARRVAGEPLEWIVGWVDFAGLRVGVEPGVFVPRRRTELLARLASEAMPPGGVLVELCCGAAAVAAVVAHDAAAAGGPAPRLHVADIDPTAVRCAARNLGAAGEAHLGDLYGALPPALRGRVDVLAANAPYVPSGEIRLMPPEAREHEPLATLDGGPDGVALHRRIARDAADWLAPHGVLLIETSRRQAPLTAAAMHAAGLTPTPHRDDDLAATVVAGRRR